MILDLVLLKLDGIKDQNFKILIEAGEEEKIPVHLTLNSRQKFERIAAKYPLVRELKSRLNLDIDY